LQPFPSNVCNREFTGVYPRKLPAENIQLYSWSKNVNLVMKQPLCVDEAPVAHVGVIYPEHEMN
jgi:hypothetical protein